MCYYIKGKKRYNMNENKRMLIFFISIILIVAVILAIAFWPEPDKTFTCSVKADSDYSNLGSINYKQYECLSKQDSKFALAISDGLNNNEKEALNEAAKEIGRGIYYLSDELSNSDLKNIKNDLKTDKASYDDTALVIVENGKVTNGLDKNINKTDAINKFLKDSNFVKFTCGVQTDEEYTNLARLTADQYDCLYNSDTPFIMAITQSTCSYCEQYLPYLNEYAGENDLPAYILEIDTMDSEDVQNIISSLDYFDDNSSWGTPLTLAIQDKKVVKDISGYTNKEEDLNSIFEEIGLK